MPDAMRFCRDAMPNVQNVLICFGQNREKISNRCRPCWQATGCNKLPLTRADPPDLTNECRRPLKRG